MKGNEQKRLTTVRKRYHLLLTSDADNDRILESDWTKCTPGHTQTRVTVLDAIFPSWLYPCKKLKISIVYFQFYCWSNNPSIWLDERNNRPHSTNYDHFILSTDIDHRNILQLNWTRVTIDHIQPNEVVPDATFAWWLFQNIGDSEILTIKESYIQIGREATLSTPNQK